MATIIRGTKIATGTVNFGASTKAKSAEVNTDFNTVYAAFNGNIENDNIKAGAEISVSKLAGLTADYVLTAHGAGNTVTWEAPASGGASFTTGTFTSGTLTAGILTIMHNLNLDAPYTTHITFADGDRKMCFPSDVTYTADSLTADFLSYGTLSGTYSWSIVA